MKNIETKWSYDFLMLGACCHFSQAVKEHNLSQSALSRRTKAFKSTAEVLLFDRTTSPLQLTEKGKLFHSQTRSLLQWLEYNLDESSGHNLLGVPNIKIAVVHSLSLTMLPGSVHSILAWGGEFVYRVETIDIVQVVNILREGRSDFIISLRDEDLMQSLFYDLKVFGSELYPVYTVDAQGRVLFDIYQLQVLILNYINTPYTRRLVNCHPAEADSISACMLFMSSVGELLKNMVLDGHGIAQLSMRVIVNKPWGKHLVCLDTLELMVPIQVYIY